MMIRALFSFVLCLFLVAQAQAQAAKVLAAAPAASGAFDRVAHIDPVVQEGKLYIDADVDFAVNSDLRNAAQKGVPIYFTADLEITSKRWWWFDKVEVNEQLTWRIVYNALTRQWRVGTGDLLMSESSLDDALSLVRHIRGWDVANTSDLEPGRTYHGRMRVRLNTSLLARPFQIDALNSSAWSLATPWKDFSFSISVDAHDPS
jgi:hypothetical protein